jgi:hypothetical protein
LTIRTPWSIVVAGRGELEKDMRLIAVVGLVSGLAWVPLACSTNTGGLFSHASPGDGSGGSSAGGSTSTSTSAQSDGGGGPGPGPTTSVSDGTGGSAAGPQSSVASSSSTGMDPKVEIPCGAQTCTGTDVCCVSQFDPGQDHCAASGQCGNYFVEVGCNGPMDCVASEICCGRYTQQMGYLEVSCAPTCITTTQSYGIVMCGDDPTACGPTEACYQSQSLPQGHMFCQ